MSVPLYFPQQQLDGLYAVYSADGDLIYADIETLGDARDHVLDLTAAAQADDAAQDDFDADQVAEAA
ncbi:hypothetical protein [Methylorubrum suomiense]|uniref:Uncharacterized protein n=1 Tax=Methylorubrum suomiense TaxID=144191 RepID=A0ABQ4UZE8_9HYPH|nr:hypothetical protein [Methylorubrum suomiense]GJE77215.1 hypothetical protein BGCPKDLD_3818 [Methylorubrum suomiense]